MHPRETCRCRSRTFRSGRQCFPRPPFSPTRPFRRPVVRGAPRNPATPTRIRAPAGRPFPVGERAPGEPFRPIGRCRSRHTRSGGAAARPASLNRSEGSLASRATKSADEASRSLALPRSWPGPMSGRGPAPDDASAVGADSPAASRRLCRGVTGDSPRASLARTSFAVDGEMCATLAIERNDAAGLAAIRSAARRRASAPSTGRILPSRPILTFDCPIRSVAHPRIVATVPAARPVTAAIRRSDHVGCDSTMRAAAIFRSAVDSGSPCAWLSSTARTKASASSPVKNSTSMASSPRNTAARTRCTPSMTFMVGRWTTTGGSGVSIAASILVCSTCSPWTRGESTITSRAMDTLSGTAANMSRSASSSSTAPPLRVRTVRAPRTLQRPSTAPIR